MSELVSFYAGRLKACPNYGAHSGFALLDKVRGCLDHDHTDGLLSDSEWSELWKLSFEIADVLIEMF